MVTDDVRLCPGDELKRTVSHCPRPVESVLARPGQREGEVVLVAMAMKDVGDCATSGLVRFDKDDVLAWLAVSPV